MASQDMDLVREYAAHQSEPAFETLVSRHIHLVYSSALRQVGDAHLAEEITQAVFILLARKAASLGAGTILPGWLYRTTCYVAKNALRAQRRRQRREHEAFMQSTLPEEPTDAVWEQLSPLLDEALLRLRQHDRDALVLRFFQNKSLQEVGAALGTTEGAAKKRVGRALEQLRAFFTKRGVTSTTGTIAGALAVHSVHAAPAALVKAVTPLAVAKGAAASASTLTLIKGALKLMAWSKAKTAMVAGAAILLTGGACLVTSKVVHALRAAHAPNIEGAWEGTMLLDEAGPAAGEAARTRVVLKLTRTNGVYQATTDWIEMGIRDLPMGKVTYDYPALHLERNPRDKWNLRINDDATQMILEHAVHFIQPAPVLLRRTAAPDPVPEHLAESDFAPRPGSALQGYWKGTVGPDALPVDVKIAEQPDGTLRAEGDDPMEGANGRPVSVVYTWPTVKITPATGAGMFEGTLDRANTQISGSWTQGGQFFPVTLQRADYRAEHAHDAERDYSFASATELQGHWKGTWILPFAKLKLPMRFALDIAKLPDGSYSAAVADLDRFGQDDFIPASAFRYEPPEVFVERKWAEGSYTGRLEGGKLVGTWSQGGGGFPLVFERSESK